MPGLNLVLFILYHIVVVLTIVHVLMDNRQPAKTMAWALVIYFVPFIGIIFYYFFGINTRRERMMSERSLNQLTKRAMLEFVEQHDLHVPERQRQLVDLFINQNLAMPFKDNAIEVFTEGRGYFASLLRDIGRAKRHIHIDIYIFGDDALGRLVADALIDRARQGVEVRVVYDDVGCWSTRHRFFERMREEGIEVCPFLPVRFPTFTRKVNYRNHRKIIVIDGKVGYIGGMNIAKRYAAGDRGGDWRDTMARIEGGAVYGLQRAFLVDWYFVDRTLISNRKYYPPLEDTPKNNCIAQVVTSSPVSKYPDIMQGYVRLILSARRYVYIETPYFLPNEPVLFALRMAAVGGIDVRIVVPWRTDSMFVEWASRSYLRDMATAGAKVYLYKGGFMHSKLIVSDDAIASCGSTNVDFRSFENNFESNVFFYDVSTALRFRRIIERDTERCALLAETPRRMNPKFLERLWESLTRLLSPLF